MRLLLPDASYQPQRTYALTELPSHQQHQQDRLAHHVDVVGHPAASSAVLLEGMFWNYFSVGADAQAAYNFHHLRDTHPALASNRLANQFWYSAFSCTSGWWVGGASWRLLAATCVMSSQEHKTQDSCLLYDLYAIVAMCGIHRFVQKACHLSALPTVTCTSAIVNLMIGLLLVCITHETQLSTIYHVLALQGGSAVPCSL